MLIKLFYGNKTTISVTKNLVQPDKIEHLKIRQHFIKERLDNGSICISYIPSSQLVANVLTKGLLRRSFDSCASKLSLIDIYVTNSRGVLKLVGLA